MQWREKRGVPRCQSVGVALSASLLGFFCCRTTGAHNCGCWAGLCGVGAWLGTKKKKRQRDCLSAVQLHHHHTPLGADDDHCSLCLLHTPSLVSPLFSDTRYSLACFSHGNSVPRLKREAPERRGVPGAGRVGHHHDLARFR
jgi:hypothetical protein